MNKYKVEFKVYTTYVIDVLAKTETEAQEKATEKWDEVCAQDQHHNYQTDDDNTDVTIYNVTHTDDPFNP